MEVSSLFWKPRLAPAESETCDLINFQLVQLCAPNACSTETVRLVGKSRAMPLCGTSAERVAILIGALQIKDSTVVPNVSSVFTHLFTLAHATVWFTLDINSMFFGRASGSLANGKKKPLFWLQMHGYWVIFVVAYYACLHNQFRFVYIFFNRLSLVWI